MAKKRKIERPIPELRIPSIENKKPSKVIPKRKPEPTEFLEDIKLGELIKTEMPPKDDKEISDMGMVTKELLQQESESLLTKPLAPIVKKSEEEELEDIIKTVEKEVDTPKNIKGGGRIDDSDMVSKEDLIDKITKQEVKYAIKIKPVPVKPIRASLLEERDRIRLEEEEKRRREIERERNKEIAEASEDEQKRRNLFDEEIQQKRQEFQLYLDDTFPEFSKINSKNLKKFSKEELEQREIKRIEDRRTISLNKNAIKKLKKDLQLKKVERLKKEQIRKAEEGNFKINRVRRSEVHTFFEGDVLLEQKEKQERNPDINKETEVQIRLKEIARLEKQLGRKIVPHRDIIESEESDFDLNSEIKPDDILIVVPKDNEPLKEYNKLNRLVNIRKFLDRDKKEDIDYIKTKNQEPKEIPLFRKNEEN